MVTARVEYNQVAFVGGLSDHNSSAVRERSVYNQYRFRKRGSNHQVSAWEGMLAVVVGEVVLHLRHPDSSLSYNPYTMSAKRFRNTLSALISLKSRRTQSIVSLKPAVMNSKLSNLDTPNGKGNSNEKLYFDILYQIFEYYADFETPSHPLETLLLVCKFWSQAACEHPRLWARFDMKTINLKTWCCRIPLRLGRCSPDSPLDISILVNSRISTVWFVLRAIELLAGPDGRVAQHWRRFSLDDPTDVLSRQPRLAWLLSFPTPRLEELCLYGMITSMPIFPANPALKTFKARNIILGAFPDLSAVTEVSLDADAASRHRFGDVSSNLVRLDISRGNSDYRLTSVYPRLTSLSLVSGILRGGLDRFGAPKLTHLNVSFNSGSEFLAVLSCQGLPIHQIKEVQIGSELPLAMEGNELHRVGYRNGLGRFLRAIQSVQVLTLREPFITDLVLNLLGSDCKALYQNHVLLLIIDGIAMELGQGEHRQDSLHEIRRATEGKSFGRWGEVFPTDD